MGSVCQPSTEIQIVELVLADILEQLPESKDDSINLISSVPNQSTSSNTAMDTSAPSFPNCGFITSTKESQITDIPPNISNNTGEPTEPGKRRKRERNPTGTTPNVSNVAGVAGELAKKETSRKRKRKSKMYESDLKNDPKVKRAIRAKKHRESKKIDEQKLKEEIAILKQKCESHQALIEENLSLTKKVENQAKMIAEIKAKLETKIANQAETVEMIQYFYKVAKLLPQNAEICISSEVLKTLAPVLSDEEVEKNCYDAAKNDSEAAKPTFNKRFLKMTSTIDFSTDNPQQSRPKINLLTDDA